MKKITLPQHALGISIWPAVLFIFALTFASMIGLYFLRFNRLPWQPGPNPLLMNITPGAKMTAPEQAPPKPDLKGAASFDKGIKRCIIDGKTVYSDHQCNSNDASTRDVKLKDNASEGLRKPVLAETSASGATINQKMLDKVLDGN